jgi:hypothetical protein
MKRTPFSRSQAMAGRELSIRIAARVSSAWPRVTFIRVS